MRGSQDKYSDCDDKQGTITKICEIFEKRCKNAEILIGSMPNVEFREKYSVKFAEFCSDFCSFLDLFGPNCIPFIAFCFLHHSCENSNSKVWKIFELLILARSGDLNQPFVPGYERVARFG